MMAGRGVRASHSNMLGAAFGGLLLDHLSISGTFIGGAMLLVCAARITGRGDRLQPDAQIAWPMKPLTNRAAAPTH